jgi:pyruvate kinase
MARQTKIVATLGPASSTPEMLERLINAGVDVVRLNFSHGTAQDHIDRAAMVRSAAERAGRAVAIMADLQGPKIRVGKFEGGKTELRAGQKFVLDGARSELGDNACRPRLQGVASGCEPATRCCSTTACWCSASTRCSVSAS